MRYIKIMESEPQPEQPERDNERLTAVFIGEVLAWVAITEYYAKYNT